MSSPLLIPMDYKLHDVHNDNNRFEEINTQIFPNLNDVINKLGRITSLDD